MSGDDRPSLFNGRQWAICRIRLYIINSGCRQAFVFGGLVAHTRDRLRLVHAVNTRLEAGCPGKPTGRTGGPFLIAYITDPVCGTSSATWTSCVRSRHLHPLVRSAVPLAHREQGGGVEWKECVSDCPFTHMRM